MKISWIDRIFKPFEYHTSKQLLFLGCFGFVVLVILAYLWQFNCDGIFQLHSGKARPIYKILVNHSMNSLLLAGVLFGFGLIVYKKTRFLDVLTTVLLAQLSILLVAVLLLNPYQQSIASRITKSFLSRPEPAAEIGLSDTLMMLIPALLAIALLVYFFYLLITGMSTAMNTRKWGHKALVLLLTLVLDTALHSINPYWL